MGKIFPDAFTSPNGNQSRGGQDAVGLADEPYKGRLEPQLFCMRRSRVEIVTAPTRHSHSAVLLVAASGNGASDFGFPL